VRSMTFQTLTCGIRQNEASAPNGESALHGALGVTIAAITSMQDYKIDALGGRASTHPNTICIGFPAT
jgi:hypothetical protein